MKKILGILLIPFLISCATITVNVYFPDKDVEAAYEDIESGLDFDSVPTRKDTAAVTKPKTKRKSEALWGVAPAWADEQVDINKHLKKMEDVQESLERRRERLSTLARLSDAFLVGLDKNGRIARLPATLRPDSPPAESVSDIFGEEGGDTALTEFIAAENADRKILIRGMAVATLRATEQNEKDKATLADAVGKSEDLFAKRQIEKLKTGWFYQDESGDWRRVEPPPAEEE